MASEGVADDMPQMVRPAFNELIHSPVRLQVCAMLSNVAQLLFADVQAVLGVTDSHLSKNVRVLVDAGLLSLYKTPLPDSGHSRPVTVLSLTPAGRNAYRAHAAWLAEVTHGPTKGNLE